MKNFAVVAVLAVSGCAAPYRQITPPPTEADMIDFKLPLHCKSKEQCDRWWRTAQVWAVKNAGFKVQVATDAILQTFNATPGVAGYSVQISRAPEPTGGEVFEIEAKCGWPGHCDRAYETFIADFKRAILGTK